MDLYNLLPSIIKEKDRLGSGIGFSNEETILQKYFYAFEEVYDVTLEQATDLVQLLDPDNCPVAYFPYLEYFLGSNWPADWSEEKKRMVLRSLVKLYHHSGQRLSWESVLNMLGYSGFFPWELWKADIYEDFDYFLYGGGDDYYGTFHAARIDIRNANETEKLLSVDEKRLIEYFRPIHVLFRERGIRVLEQEDIVGAVLSETLELAATNEFFDSLAEADDTLSVDVTCVATCEVSSD